MEWDQSSIKDWSEIARNFIFVLAGVAAGVGIWLAWRRTKALETQAATDTERHITESFTRAIDQLGKDELEIRLGAIYALERIAKSSKKDHWPIMEILTVYVRENAPWPSRPSRAKKPDTGSGSSEQREDGEGRKPPADIQAILTVLTRRNVDYESELQELNLSDTDLRGANLEQIDLQNAQLSSSNLEEAILYGAKLYKANLFNANLERAILWFANLRESTLIDANLQSAFFGNADLAGADLGGANLEGGEDLTQEQLDAAFGDDNTKLPASLTVPKGPEENNV